MSADDEAPVFRAPMRSRHSLAVEGAAVERALTHGVCGLGGASLDPPPVILADAVSRITATGDDRLAARLARFADAPDGAFVWTSDPDGLLWLGRLNGPWYYDVRSAAAEVDLVHVRPCRWLAAPVAEHRVPAGVRATFARGGKNWQRIRSAAAFQASSRLWAQSFRSEQ
ncbi:MAG: GAF domain-containing protein [Microbacterium sp.]|uniref:GAF domain-containing protein n=1 Tax=Microbacterium sp. TaxID=51671 RepID=UPI002721D6ED|nr:GAF domain-containing protein [Microbacterium sp.]MDO8384751.1 GAF domain-containing protein [Microbacterium sp.]